MEKVCEFCVTLRSVIYCKADAAHLCLSCDSKVHSANPLSSRHPRTLVCESCKYRPTYVRCFDHQLFMCRGCDQSQHEFSSQHRKRVISSYMGCPSAQDLAALWGYNSNDFGPCNLQEMASVNVGGVISSGSRKSASAAKSEVGPSSRHSKAFNSRKRKENTSYIVQQLLNLRQPHPAEDCETFSLIRHQEQTDISSSNSNLLKLENDSAQNLQQPNGFGDDPQRVAHPQQELNLEPYSSPFSQLNQLTSSSADGSHLQDDSFWQCKSPDQSGQLWSHNMQDLGVCEELGSFDDLNIPDVDLTFRNFEELFRGDQEQTEDIGMACSSLDTNTSFDRSDHIHGTKMEDHTSVASYVSVTQSSLIDKHMSSPKIARLSSRSEDYPRQLKPSYSALSFSLSRLSAESNGTDYMDSGLSPILFGHEPSCNSSHQVTTSQEEAKANLMTTYKEEINKDQRNDQKQGQCAYRRPRSDVRKRSKSQILKAEGYERDMAKSY